MTGNHRSFWDCVESDSTKKSIVRLTPDALCDKIEIHTCETCGRKHCLEIWFFEDSKEIADTNRYGFKNPKEIEFEEILESYDVER